MAVGHTSIQWNRQKRWYDFVLVLGSVLGLAGFLATSFAVRPDITIETAIIRAFSVTAFLLLHVILCIGPLARLDRRFLPWLYNRRHLGVTMFLLALVHAAFSLIQFHALGPKFPLVSVFTAYRQSYNPLAAGIRVSDFPFEPFGVIALAILFLMAATSHDFWLKNLGASFWKRLHILVLVAYGMLVVHVAYGILQSERSALYLLLLVAGAAVVVGLHVAAALREARADADGDGTGAAAAREGFVRVGATSDLREGHGKVVRVGDRRVAVFLHEGKVYGLSNVCRHQGGPLGEGRILQGCVTCPWHGWQYKPEDGQSPPPFEEKIATYRVRVEGGQVFVHPEAAPPGTPQPGAALVEAE